MDPTLRRIDEVLDDEELVDRVLDAMRGRFKQSARRGRKGTPAEVALRLLVLKHLKKWSYEELQWEVAGFAHRDHPFRAIVTGRSGPS